MMAMLGSLMNIVGKEFIDPTKAIRAASLAAVGRPFC